jgi:diguanylate cyclase (GGDEF)-like protein
MKDLEMLNATKGRGYGDSAIRWLGIVLQEETNVPIYRIGGDEFAVILTSGTRSNYEELLNRIYARINREGEQLGISTPAARIALIHYDDANISLNDVMFQLGEAMLNVKTKMESSINIFFAKDLIGSETTSKEYEGRDDKSSQDTLRWIANHAIRRVLFMGRILDDAQKTSFLDSISGLPNMRAALFKLEKELASKQPFAILLMDGDNLTRYNNISYAAGDEMIQKISAVLSQKLRPGDFIARWRAGDEFIVILPYTDSEGAMIVGNRFCSAIREATHAWQFPTSITIGVAIHPKHGHTLNELVDMAEGALKKGKAEGKDRVVLAE